MAEEAMRRGGVEERRGVPWNGLRRAGFRARANAARRAPEEEVIRVGREAAALKQPQKVGELAVDVAHDLKRSLQLKERRLTVHDSHGLFNHVRYLIRRKVHGGAGLFCASAGGSGRCEPRTGCCPVFRLRRRFHVIHRILSMAALNFSMILSTLSSAIVPDNCVCRAKVFCEFGPRKAGFGARVVTRRGQQKPSQAQVVWFTVVCVGGDGIRPPQSSPRDPRIQGGSGSYGTGGGR
jgi:hypothetical protein